MERETETLLGLIQVFMHRCKKFSYEQQQTDNLNQNDLKQAEGGPSFLLSVILRK